MSTVQPKLKCDVLVIGGGIAALTAGISAAELGAKVILVDKGITGKSGSSAKAAGILAASFGHGDLETRPWPDSPCNHVKDTLLVGHNIGDSQLVRHVADHATNAVIWLESMGVTFSRAGDGGFLQLNAPGNSCPRGCSAVGGGKAIMRKLIIKAKELGVIMMNNTGVRRLSKYNNRVVGAELQMECKRLALSSGSVVLAAGGATGLFHTCSGDNNNMGAGLMLGFDVGAKLGNLEFIEFTLIYRVKNQLLRIAGLAPFMSRGAKLVNAAGRMLIDIYYPTQRNKEISRADLLRMVQTEIISGRGPVVMDCTHFTESIWSEFQESQGDVVLDRIAATGCDYKTEVIEVVPAAHSILAGLIIDTNASTGVDGLYAAGENVTGIHGAGRLSGNGLTASVVMGRTAGKNACSYAFDNKLFSIQENKKSSAQISETPEGLKLITDSIRDLASHNLGVIRNESDLSLACQGFDRISQQILKFDMENHEVWEAYQMALLGKMMAESALKRKESRGVQFRSDYLDLDRNWDFSQIQEKKINLA